MTVPHTPGEVFDVVSADGTGLAGWRNGAAAVGPAVVIAGGLGTVPQTWPSLLAEDCGYRVSSWYYRGTFGTQRPADSSHIRVEDHVDDLIALMDHEGIERAVVPCWSMGVNIAFEAALRHPDRVAGLLAVAGVPGGTFRSMGAPLQIPRPLRHLVGVTGARVLRLAAPLINPITDAIPATPRTAWLLSHTGFIMPSAHRDDLVATLQAFLKHDFGWYFTLALGLADHAPMDLSFVKVPTTLVAGRYDVLTAAADILEASGQIPDSQVALLPGSHFLPLEFPSEIRQLLAELVERVDLAV